jgi:SagB-type dehydrogenase family enzyme
MKPWMRCMMLWMPVALLLSACGGDATPVASSTTPPSDALPLPEPAYDGDVSVEAALRERRSVRDYAARPLTLAEVGQLLWAAQGITGDNQRYRTAPSAGALYPLELYVVAGDVRDLDPGVYRYRPAGHALEPIAGGDVRPALAGAALEQTWVEEGAVVLVVAGVYERTTQKYGERGRQYVHMEAGHAAQNVYLQAAALELGTVAVGAFRDDEVQRVVGLAPDEVPLYLLPVGPLP